MTETPLTRLDIMSDPICPWCYIGKAGLDAALAGEDAPPFEIRWHPFQFNPDMPAGGMDRRAYLEGKFGGPEAAAEAYAPIAGRARDAGLAMDLDAIARTPNTLDAHRLIHWAGIEERQEAVVDALFAAYFAHGRDIGAHDVLADVADGAGMDAALVLRLLASDADAAETRARDNAAREMGVSAVPTFIVGGRQAVPGAQPAALWSRVIAELREGSAA